MGAALLVGLGVIAIQPAPAAEAATDRIAGVDRYSTSVEVSRQLPASTGGVVFLASGLDFPDALAASPVAAAERGRLLLSSPGDIPDVVAAELRRLQPREIVLVGGEPTLGEAVRAEAASIAPTVTRIGGAGRVETSMLLLDRMRLTTQPTELWVVSGTSFPDALAASAVAARLGHAVVLSVAGDTRFEGLLAPRVQGVRRITVAGGPSSVSQVDQDIASRYVSTQRIAGADRYRTATAINLAFTPSASGARMVLVSGENFPDGLVGSMLAGMRGQPLYLVPQACLTSDAVAQEVRRLGIQSTTVIGGTPSVSQESARLERCPDVGASQAEVIAQVNAHRAMAGLPALTAHAGLMPMAQGWSQQMAASQSMVHSTTFCDETFRMGFRRCGENIAANGSTSASGVMGQWMNSAGHRANVLNARFTHIGVGLAQGANGRWYWTQNFGGS